MKALVTGAAGFMASRLVDLLLERPDLERLVLLDMVEAQAPRDDRVEVVVADVADIGSHIDSDGLSVFHLASPPSAAAEADFDAALRSNVDGLRALLDALREREGSRLVLTSSLGVYGGADMPTVVAEGTRHNPQTTYGMTKAVGELLINDYARRGLVDARGARLPAMVVRPGAPSAAISAYASSIVREPLAGRPYVVPVGYDVCVPVIGYRTVAATLLYLHDIDADRLGDDRTVLCPGVSATVRDLIDSVHRVAGDRPLAELEVKPDPAVDEIASKWMRETDATRALELGFPADADIDSIVRAYIEDYVDDATPGGAPQP
ncbi:MAG: NAD-dependent epimerase/dehydratase family protein [Thermoleophilaceae bacterium]